MWTLLRALVHAARITTMLLPRAWSCEREDKKGWTDVVVVPCVCMYVCSMYISHTTMFASLVMVTLIHLRCGASWAMAYVAAAGAGTGARREGLE